MVYYSYIFMAFAQTTDFAFKPTLSGAGEEAQASSMLRQRSRFQPDVLKTPGTLDTPLPQPNKNRSFSSVLRQARALKSGEESSALSNEAKQVASQAISGTTSELLQQAWYNAVETFGATLLYLNIHVFCRWVFGEEYFCKLGHEWIGGKKGAKTSKSSASILGLPLDGLGLLETAVLVIVDALFLFIVLIQVAFIVLIAYMVAHPLQALWSAGFGGLWDSVKAAWNLIVI